jgi:Zn-dependent metalloprotease
MKVETDELGYLRFRYAQRYNGYPVEHTDFFLHYKDSLLVEATALVVPNFNLSTTRGLTEATALNNALAYLNATEYAWQNADLEAEIREETGDSTATYYPKGELVIARIAGEQLRAQNYKFAYRFNITSVQPFAHDYVYVDANTGIVFQKTTLMHSCTKHCQHPTPFKSFGKKLFEPRKINSDCDKDGTATTLYNGNQAIKTTYRKWPFKDHILKECDRNIHTKWGWGLNPEVTDKDGNWDESDQAATSAHWAMERTWDFYKFTYGRSGANGNNRQVKILADENNSANNAGWDLSSGNNDKIRLGRWLFNDPINGFVANNMPLASLDIVGHEFSHGVVQATSNLVYENESGALNESFADIFGTMVERYGQNGIFNWTIAEATGNIFRSMSNPNDFNQPDRFQGIFWQPLAANPNQNNDYGGVHINSGVQNRWFHLLSVGGTVTIGANTFNVQGIGIDKAASIAYHNFTARLQQTSGYAQAREGSIQSAIDLYGACSFEVAQVRNAWAAVGVGLPQQGGCIRINGLTNRCIPISNTLSYNAISTFNLPIIWSASSPIILTPSGVNNENVTLSNIPTGVTQITLTASVSVPGGRVVSNTVVISLRNCQRPPCPGCPKDQWRGLEQYYTVERSASYVSVVEIPTAISVAPNPTSNFVQIDLGTENIQNASVTILNTQGLEVGKFVLTQKITSLDISKFSAGLYVLHVYNADVRKIIKLIVSK